MNLKKLDKTWRESCPDEATGLIRKRKKGNMWNRIILSSEAKQRLNKDKK